MNKNDTEKLAAALRLSLDAFSVKALINYIPEKVFGNIMFLSATQPPPRGSPPPHHNIVSTITFEGIKLRSSNLTHALPIQIYRTSSITDIVVPSKMAAVGGHFVKKNS